MLIRKPVGEVFQVLVDPAIATRFWYSKSTGPMTPGARLEWSWELYEVSAAITVTEVEENTPIIFKWNETSTIDHGRVPIHPLP